MAAQGPFWGQNAFLFHFQISNGNIDDSQTSHNAFQDFPGSVASRRFLRFSWTCPTKPTDRFKKILKSDVMYARVLNIATAKFRGFQGPKCEGVMSTTDKWQAIIVSKVASYS